MIVAEFIYAKKVFTGSEIVDEQLIVLDQGKITEIKSYNGEEVSFRYEYIAPGFFDTHINGGWKNYFTKDANIETLKDIEESCMAEGTVYTLPTLITSPLENIIKGINAVKQYKKLNPSTGIIGMHLEGPFLHPLKRGAHPKEFVQSPTDAVLHKIVDEGEGIITLMTIAPELFTDAQINILLDSGINISVGHSNATYEEAQHAFNKGITLVTHLYNAMSPFTHRAPGLIGAALDNDDVYTPVIVDGDHSHFSSAQIAWKIKREKFFLISDALFVDSRVKEFQWGNFDSVLKDGKYMNSEGNLSGATISLADAVRNAVDKLGVPLQEAVEMATSRPAKAMRLENRIGKIAVGYPAAFTVFDAGLTHFQCMSQQARI